MDVKNTKCDNRRGFTLVELLFVIVIIGLLAAAAGAALNNAKMKSRDVRRLADMEALRKAFEVAKTDGLTLPQVYTHTASASFNFLVPKYLAAVPVEVYPASTNSADLYYYCNVNTQSSGNLCHNDTDPVTYAIRFKMEKPSSLGAAGYYCLTSQGVFLRESGNNGTNKCTQR